MQIPSLSKALAFPFIILLIFYFTKGRFWSATADTWTLIPSVFALVLLYVFQEQINKWWWKRHPPLLDEKIIAWISVYSSYFKRLDVANKKKFSDRLSRFMKVKDFTLKGKKDFQLEEDTKALIGHEFMRLVINREDSSYGHFEHFILYNHPFASPNYQFLHSFELNVEDGVIIFSREQLVNGFNKGLAYFNIAIYGAICAFVSLHPRLKYPIVNNLSVEAICDASHMNMDSIITTLGYKEITKLSLLIYAFMEYPEKIKLTYPHKFEQLAEIFGEK